MEPALRQAGVEMVTTMSQFLVMAPRLAEPAVPF